MRIEYIKLYNYRLYKGLNQVSFPKDDEKNIYIIYGENGFGKTTLLQSLMWCLYGRMIIDVDDLSKAVIYTKGYENYLRENLNVEIGSDISNDDKKYFVEILISELQIPTLPSTSLQIKRSYDLVKNKESFELLIDGHENELARQIGYDVFVNDFVLSKDIARLFLFDSERIVKLAEGQSKEERVRFGAAYHHVIGIKKFEELRSNLEGIATKMKREALDDAGETKWQQLSLEMIDADKELSRIEESVTEITLKIEALKQELSSVQTQLLREGSIVDLEAKKNAVEEKEACIQRNQEFKNQLKDYIELAPFAIAGWLFRDATLRVEHDFKVAESKNGFNRQKETIIEIQRKMESIVVNTIKGVEQKKQLLQQIESILSDYQVEPINESVLLEVDKEAHDLMMSVSAMLYTSFQAEFKTMLDEYKHNKQQIDKLNKLIHRADEEGENDKIVPLKKHQESLLEAITDQEQELLDLSILKAQKSQERQKLQSQYDKYHASMKVRESNKEKSELIDVLIKELDDYLIHLRSMRNKSIEQRIKRILNSLMHKNDFVDRILLETDADDFDVHLYYSNIEIQKKSLSMGEQQLYATALLMALVEESGISFPVFIDSPLQKFDKKHAERIITDFYPKVSSQVVLLPIVEKEMTTEEESLMQPLIKARFRIVNDGMHSQIVEQCLSR